MKVDALMSFVDDVAEAAYSLKHDPCKQGSWSVKAYSGVIPELTTNNAPPTCFSH